MDISEVDKIYYLNLFITDKNGDPKVGLSTSYSIYKSSDDSIVDSGNLTDKNNGNYTGSFTFTSLGHYYIIYNTPTGYTNEIETVMVEKSGAKSEDMLRLLGLSDENKKIYNTVYDANQNLTYSLVKIFANATDYVNDNNEIGIYEMVASYGSNNEMLNMGVKRIQ